MIRTVLGDIAPTRGPVLVHEHLQIDLSAQKGPNNVLGPVQEDEIVADLQAATGAEAVGGGRSLCHTPILPRPDRPEFRSRKDGKSKAPKMPGMRRNRSKDRWSSSLWMLPTGVAWPWI